MSLIINLLHRVPLLWKLQYIASYRHCSKPIHFNECVQLVSGFISVHEQCLLTVQKVVPRVYVNGQDEVFGWETWKVRIWSTAIVQMSIHLLTILKICNTLKQSGNYMYHFKFQWLCTLPTQCGTVCISLKNFNRFTVVTVFSVQNEFGSVT
jgi:hypothetical protein